MIQSLRRTSPLAALLLLALLVRDASAHANLLRAEPAPNSAHPTPPTAVVLWFSEPLEPAASGILLLDGSGQPVTPATATVDPADAAIMRLALPPLQPGLYTVAWHTLSTVDGHVTRGVYPFVVGEGQAAPVGSMAGGSAPPGSFGEARPLDVLARIAALIGGALVMGGCALHLALWRPVRAALALPPTAGDPALARLLALGIGGLMAGLLLTLIAQLIAIGPFGSPAAVFFQSRFGAVTGLRLAIIVLLALLARRAAGGGGWPPLLGGVVASALLFVTTTALSHSAALTNAQAAALLNHWLHLSAASLWLGGLAHLLLVVLPAVRSLPAERRGEALATLIARFSPLAGAAVAALVASGMLSSWLHVGNRAALLTTAYGQTLLLKLALIVPLLALAARHLRHARRRVAADQGAQRRFGRTLAGETAVGGLVLVVAGLLTGLGPARTALQAQQAEALTLRQPIPPLAAALTIRPPQPGVSRFELRLTTERGQPYTTARRVRLRFTPPDASLGTTETLAEAQPDGSYLAEGAFLSLTGPWQVELQVQRPEGYDLFARYDLLVSESIRQAAPATGATTVARLEWGLIGTGAGIVLLAFWLRRQRPHLATAPLVLVVGLVLLSVGWLFGSAPLAADEVRRGTVNPVQPTADSIAQGEALYTQHCVKCHGPAGEGDGPLAASLTPPPLNLQIHAPLHTDGEIFGWLTEGIPGTAMPAFAGTIPTEGRWHLVNYLRALTAR